MYIPSELGHNALISRSLKLDQADRDDHLHTVQLKPVSQYSKNVISELKYVTNSLKSASHKHHID